MSLNWVMLDERKQPVPLPNERVLSTLNDAQLTIHIPQSGGTPQTLTASGSVWLTTDRFIFVASAQAPSTSLFTLISQTVSSAPTQAPTTKLESLSIPWLSVLSTSFVQPYFASNYLALDVKPASGGGLELGTKVEVRLVERGMFEFVQMVEGVRAKAIEKAREARLGEPLPLYNQPPATGSNPPPQSSEDLPPGYTM